ncbi:FAD-binding oxidoreductase [Saccharothrix obliqua]|uniref:FAD-binding oxidoreductase n=1 Tax=Saccharothrix obliqua TaxID=2861747 RepID=UPI001C5F8422|nr:FAD-binding protein [Saccharothrix obliqua]MBW4717530.1 FAD-binding protein [Saccharothrix obliqua]
MTHGTGGTFASATDDAEALEELVSRHATVTPADRQYGDLVRGVNQRFVGRPDTVHLVDSTEQVPRVVQSALDAGRRIAVRSGGHCFEDFVYNPEVQVVLDLSNLNRVYYDASRDAVAVEAGAVLLQVYEKMYETWGVTIPAGICYSVGVGGHVSGGGWGLLCRQHGLVVDHLYAVEVVVVDKHRRARTVVATRDHDDPNRELWWAHTGGGGGNFGIVTRYWFRSPGARGRGPAKILPKPPSEVLLSAVSFPWSEMNQERFTALVSNYAAFHAANKSPSTPYTGFGSYLVLTHQSNGQIGLVTQMDATVPDAEQLLEDYVQAVTEGVGVERGPMTAALGERNAMPEYFTPRRLPWLQSVRYMGTTNVMLTDPTLRADYKSAYMRANFPQSQIDALYRHLTRTDHTNPNISVTLSSFGGRVNAVPRSATASVHRDSAFKLLWMVLWTDPAGDDANIGWLRECYEDVYADTGGVPVPNAVTDGCYINYCDNDLGDPARNRSGVPWHDLYYEDNYPRLQRIKAAWDPHDVFRHAQSIRLPGN